MIGPIKPICYKHATPVKKHVVGKRLGRHGELHDRYDCAECKKARRARFKEKHGGDFLPIVSTTRNPHVTTRQRTVTTHRVFTEPTPRRVDDKWKIAAYEAHLANGYSEESARAWAHLPKEENQ